MAALHWALILGEKHGKEAKAWSEMEREKWERANAAGAVYESPLCVTMIAGRAGWGLRHIVEAFPPVACREMFPLVTAYMQWRAYQTMPHAGGFMDQPARMMSAFRILGSAMAEIEESRKKVEEWNRGGRKGR